MMGRGREEGRRRETKAARGGRSSDVTAMTDGAFSVGWGLRYGMLWYAIVWYGTGCTLNRWRGHKNGTGQDRKWDAGCPTGGIVYITRPKSGGREIVLI